MHNTDYKIIANLLANRLKTVLLLLINNDQTSYTVENSKLLLNIFFFIEQTHLGAFFLTINFEKAFNWKGLSKWWVNNVNKGRRPH